MLKVDIPRNHGQLQPPKRLEGKWGPDLSEADAIKVRDSVYPYLSIHPVEPTHLALHIPGSKCGLGEGPEEEERGEKGNEVRSWHCAEQGRPLTFGNNQG